jgi:hypothetical protein
MRRLLEGLLVAANLFFFRIAEHVPGLPRSFR